MVNKAVIVYNRFKILLNCRINYMIKKIYEIIKPSDNESSKQSSLYDIIMLICIIASMIPLAIKSDSMVLNIIDKVTVAVFIVDYILRRITAKIKLNKGVKSYFFIRFSQWQ